MAESTKKNERPSPDSRTIHQRLHAVMQEVSYIQKEAKGGLQYSTVSHDAVTAKVRPALVKNGVLYYPHEMNYIQCGNRTEVSLTVRFANVDNPNDFIDVPSLGFGCDNQDKGPGKAVSYAVKYALLKALGLETGDDPDSGPSPDARSDRDIALDRIKAWSNMANGDLKDAVRSVVRAACPSWNGLTTVTDNQWKLTIAYLDKNDKNDFLEIFATETANA